MKRDHHYQPMIASAGLALLAGLDETQTRDALGIYYGQCAGTMQAHVEATPQLAMRSEERRVGKECRSRWSPYH